MAHFAEAMHEAQILIIENLHDLACGDLAFVRDRLCDLPPMSNAILTCRDMPREWAAPLVARGQLRIIGEDQLTRSEEHTSELQSLMRISYAVFCLKKKNTKKTRTISVH